MPMLASWLDEATRSKNAPNPNAMVLATASSDAVPSARLVLCKAIEPDAGALVFYTNYTSLKARDLCANPRTACVFHWDHTGRQARTSGLAERVSDEESSAYFKTRPLLSRLGVWASDQGRPLDRRTELVARVREAMRRFGVSPHHLLLPQSAPDIPRPEFWGGYRIRLDMVELWLGGGGRLHDRAVWNRSLDPTNTRPPHWSATRLQP